VPFTIVRPAVIESADTYPFAGWNEGINTSAPIIYMALKGQVQFPADPRLCLDIIPVDMVAAGMIASLVELSKARRRRCTSTARPTRTRARWCATSS
jgi:long-chain acyl-CoA synthetase